MLISAWKQRLLKLFELLDVDGDHFITQQDFVRLYSLLLRAKGWSGSEDGASVLHRTLMTTWETLIRRTDSSGDDRVSVEEFLASQAELRVALPQNPDAVNALAELTLALYDSDSNGQITLEDFVLVSGAHGGSLQEARELFSRLDLNGSGVLTVEEVRVLILQYYLDDDSAVPGALLFGRLQPS